MCRASYCALYSTLIVENYGTNRSQPYSDIEEGDTAFLATSYRKFWGRLINQLSKKDTKPGSALPPEGFIGSAEFLHPIDPLGTRIERTSRCGFRLHIYEKFFTTIRHHIYRVTNSRVGQW